MTDMVTGLIIGFAVGSFLLSGLLFVAIGRIRGSQAARLVSQQEAIVDLRQELAEDKETNRHLRHQIHSLTSGTDGAAVVPTDSPVGAQALDSLDAALYERDAARQELAETQRSLESVRARLADREDKLREYREAVKEIRLSLESQDRLRGIVTITDDIPANAQAETS